MSTPNIFTPSVVFADLLRKTTRTSIRDWLESEPMDVDGNPIVAIQQSYFCKANDNDGNGPNAHLVCFDSVNIGNTHVEPVLRHKSGIAAMPGMLVTGEDMIDYREPFFHLSHDETFLRLFSSDIRVILNRGGSWVRLVHTAEFTIIVSQGEPGRLPKSHQQTLNWQRDLLTIIAPSARSAHEKILRAGKIAALSPLVREVYAHHAAHSDVYALGDIPFDQEKISS